MSILDNPAKRVEHERQATYERLLESAISNDSSSRRVQYTYNDVRSVAQNLAILSANGPLSGSDVSRELATFLSSIAKALDLTDDYQDGPSLIDRRIEFKNGNVSKDEVLNKLYATLLMFQDTYGLSVEYAREHISFVLVYNHEKYGGRGAASNDPKRRVSYAFGYGTF